MVTWDNALMYESPHLQFRQLLSIFVAFYGAKRAGPGWGERAHLLVSSGFGGGEWPGVELTRRNRRAADTHTLKVSSSTSRPPVDVAHVLRAPGRSRTCISGFGRRCLFRWTTRAERYPSRR